VAEQVEDRRAEPAVDEVGEAARRLGEVVLELVAEPRERRAHDGTGLEALEERGAEPACLRERRLVPRREAVGEPRERAHERAPERMRQVARGLPQLR